jgi:hypothetical protein
MATTSSETALPASDSGAGAHGGAATDWMAPFLLFAVEPSAA